MFTCCDYCYGSGEIYCGEIYEKIAAHSNTKVAPLQTGTSTDTCLIFDEDAFKNGQGSISPEFKKFCGVSQQFVFCLNIFVILCAHKAPPYHVQSRNIVFYTHELADPDIIHFDSFDKDHRLLSHFYLFIYFTDPVVDNYYKRCVRDVSQQFVFSCLHLRYTMCSQSTPLQCPVYALQ